MPSATTQILGTAYSQMVNPSQVQPNSPAPQPQAQSQQVSQMVATKAITSLSMEGKERATKIPQKQVDGSFDSDKNKDNDGNAPGPANLSKSSKRSLAVA